MARTQQTGSVARIHVVGSVDAGQTDGRTGAGQAGRDAALTFFCG